MPVNARNMFIALACFHRQAWVAVAACVLTCYDAPAVAKVDRRWYRLPLALGVAIARPPWHALAFEVAHRAQQARPDTSEYTDLVIVTVVPIWVALISIVVFDEYYVALIAMVAAVLSRPATHGLLGVLIWAVASGTDAADSWWMSPAAALFLVA